MHLTLVAVIEGALLTAGFACWWVAMRRRRVGPWLRGPDNLGRWEIGPADFLLAVLLVYTLSQVAPILLAHALGFDLSGEPDRNATLFLAIAIQAGGFLAWLGFRFHPAGRPPREDLPFWPAVIAGFVALLFLLPPLYAANSLWVLALRAVGFDTPPQEFAEIIRSIESVSEAACWVAATVIVAPIVEELVFRGMLFRFLAARMRTLPAAALSGVLFACLHWHVPSFAALALLGIALALVYARTGRIISAIVLHALFNAHTLTALFLTA
jgi:membrane protease YdiL (CAAX protease family)